MSNELVIVVLAAGQGTRMKSRTPKVLHRLGGRSMLEHVLHQAAALEAVTTRVVVRHEREQVAAVVDDLPGVEAVDQDDVPGTGRAVQVAVATLPDDFAGDVLVLSGDVPLLQSETLAELIELHRTSGAAATLLTAVLDDPDGYGRVIRDADGSVARIVEQKDAGQAEREVTEINSGVYVFQAPALRAHLPRITTDNAQGELYLTDVVRLLRDEGAIVQAATAPDPAVALGVNDRVQLSQAAAILNARLVRHWQLQGVTILDPATTWIDDTVSLAEDVTVFPNTSLLGATSVERGAAIGPDTSLVDCEVGEDATVKRTDATLAVIGARATVGPFAYLRAGATLADGAKVGTYVEIKNSTIGEGSKVPHLSYVGDATIGAGVNFGAGTITANYDDINKLRTEVGDQVNTGVHTVLIAPVKLGDGAKTGAGAIVRKDVPPGALALSVAPQQNTEGWTEQKRAGTAAAAAAQRAQSGE
ncbi:MAG: bifunctional UDP-N-acetylglucosamine diphosphorylase/glucosamine-1-phosphate N-acetyltransferase GlmU [Microbacterium sp.]